MEAFPEAKVLLTVRDPESWYKSVKETIFQFCQSSKSFPINVLTKISGGSLTFETLDKLTTRNRINAGIKKIKSNARET